MPPRHDRARLAARQGGRDAAAIGAELESRMKAFRRVAASSFEEAAALHVDGAMLLAGGSDLVPLMQDDLASPELVIDLKRIPGADAIQVGSSGARIGALARLTDLATHAGLRRRYGALAEACRLVGTPQIRNVATLGGNLCQRPRCWYYRSRVPCWKSGARVCPAEHGLNEFLAILGGGPCWAVHPSDPAVALLALDARVQVRNPDGSGVEHPIDDLFVLPREHVERELRLDPGAVVERVTLPSKHANVRQTFLKVMQRQAWDFAVVSVAVVWPPRRRPRIVLGGVAPVPWLINPVKLPPAPEPRAKPETKEVWAARVAELALKGARPLSQNGYKVDLAKSLVRRALSSKLRRR